MNELERTAAMSISRSNNPLISISIFENTTQIIYCYEFIDDSSLSTILNKITELNIKKIFVSEGLQDFIAEKIKCEIFEIKRSDFDVELAKASIINIKGENNILLKELSYFLLGSIGALLKKNQFVFRKIKLCKINERMWLSERSVTALNLVGNDSLFSKLKFTKTKMGSDLLLKNILEPLTDVLEIKKRQSFIKILVNNENIAQEIEEILDFLPNIDILINKFLNINNLDSDSLINLILETYKLTSKLIEFIKFFEKYKNFDEFDFVKNLIQKIKDLNLEKLHLELESIFTEEYKKNKINLQRTDFIYVFKIHNELLNVLKQVYFENLDDLNQLISENFKTDVFLIYDKKKGFYLKTNNENLIKLFIKKEERTLTNSTINPTKSLFRESENSSKKFKESKSKNLNHIEVLFLIKRNKSFYFTTISVEQINTRIIDVLEKIIIILGEKVKEFIKKISEKISNLNLLINEISLIDMLHSFYIFYQKNDGCFPEFDDTLVFNESVNVLLKKGNIKKNNVFSSKVLNFNVITGENCGGKTCYLKMIGINIILSQIGCVVPCKYAKTKIFKRILTRIGDDNQSDLSSFGNELLDSKIIIEQSDKDTLILIDELGSNTNYLDGFTLLLTLCKIILEKECYVFLTSHFKEVIFYLSENKRVNFLKMNNFTITNGILEKGNVIELAKEYLPVEYVNDFLNFRRIFKEKNINQIKNNSYNFLANKILTCENNEKKDQLKKKIIDLLK